VKAIVLGQFLFFLWLQWQNFNNLPSANQMKFTIEASIYSATDSISCNEQACTHDTLCHQYYVTASKEYLISSHVFLKYFELILRYLQLVKISSKLIII